MQNINLSTNTTKKSFKTKNLNSNSDPQGIEWSQVSSHPRNLIRNFMDSKITNIFGRLNQKPKYPLTSVTAKNYIATPTRFTPIDTIDNYHFQLHHIFKSITPRDFIYPTETELILQNLETFNKTTLISQGKITCVDYFGDFVACAHEGEHVSIINLNDPGRVVKRVQLTLDQQLINHVKFLKEATGGIKLMAGGNDKSVRVFDLEAGDEPVSSIEVESYVNHFSFDRDQTRVLFAYDATEVDVYDLRSGKRAHRLIGHEDFSFGSDWHPNGFLVASTNQDLSTRIWDLRKNECLKILPGSNNSVSSVRFLKNGQYLVTGEFVSYLNFYKTCDFSIKTEIDYFGSLVGIDFPEGEEGTLFVGIKKFYGDLPGGILEIEINE